MHLRVSIIIPHWNGVAVLKECLASLQQATYNSLEIIVVDNGSDDGSPEWVKEHHPEVHLVELKRNYGYAGGCNRGVTQAKGDYVLFLNNDTVQEPDWIEPLVEYLDTHDRVAAVQPKLLNYYQRDHFDYAGAAGGLMDVLCFPFARGRLFLAQEVDRGQYDTPRRIFWASGTAILLRKELFLAAGAFDETFFAHMEEVDLCWRLYLMGYQVWCVPQSVVYHKNAVSLPMNSTRKYYLNHRNSMLMLLSNYNLPLALYLFPLRYTLEWVAFVYAVTKGDFRHVQGILMAQGWLLAHPHVISRRRRRMRALRTLKDRFLLRYFYKGSVVWEHYVMRHQTYGAIARKASS